MSVIKRDFGRLPSGEAVTAYTITNAKGASVTILDYGATVQSLLVPNRAGGWTDVVLGYDTAEEYARNDAYLGGTIGRVGNRIGQGRFSLNGTDYQLAVNDGPNHLHGGLLGYDKRMWQAEPVGEDSVRCTRLSQDGEEGYPGNLSLCVTFTLTPECALGIHYEGDTDRDTLVNLTNHSYFNLNGGGDAMDLELQVSADWFCENDEHCLPTGRLLKVEGTPFDFRTPKPVGRDIAQEDVQLRCGGGYDHNYVLAGPLAAVLYSPVTGITCTVETDCPGLQVYSGNSLTPRVGKGGVPIVTHGAVCLETQLFPDGMAHYRFPSPVLRAGEHLDSRTTYRFGLRP